MTTATMTAPATHAPAAPPADAAVVRPARPAARSVKIPGAVEYTGLGRSTLYGLIARGELPVVRVNNNLLILLSDLDALLERNRTGGRELAAAGC